MVEQVAVQYTPRERLGRYIVPDRPACLARYTYVRIGRIRYNAQCGDWTHLNDRGLRPATCCAFLTNWSETNWRRLNLADLTATKVDIDPSEWARSISSYTPKSHRNHSGGIHLCRTGSRHSSDVLTVYELSLRCEFLFCRSPTRNGLGYGDCRAQIVFCPKE